MNYIGNSFSLQMLPRNRLDFVIRAARIDGGWLPNAKSIVGHEDLARLCGLRYNRESITLKAGDKLQVIQVSGGRLPEGCTELPAGTRLEMWIIEIQ